MSCDWLCDDRWERLKGLMPGGTRGRRGPWTNNQLFIDALLFMARFGGRWCDPPAEYGHCQSVKRRYYRWVEMDVLDGILSALGQEADLEWMMIDSTIVRAHQHAGGARKEKRGGGRTPRVLAGPGEACAPQSMLPAMPGGFLFV